MLQKMLTNMSDRRLYVLPEHPFVLVHGPAGCGKSALLANIVKHIKDSDSGVDAIYHFVGCAKGTTGILLNLF